MDNPIRWKQRFANFEKAYTVFARVAVREEFDEIEKMALVQSFEFTFELAWKTLKDYLEEDGFDVQSPKATLRQAFQSELIKDGEVWMEALKVRNDTVHNYDEEMMTATVDFLAHRFFPLVRDWYYAFKRQVDA